MYLQFWITSWNTYCSRTTCGRTSSWNTYSSELPVETPIVPELPAEEPSPMGSCFSFLNYQLNTYNSWTTNNRSNLRLSLRFLNHSWNTYSSWTTCGRTSSWNTLLFLNCQQKETLLYFLNYRLICLQTYLKCRICLQTYLNYSIYLELPSDLLFRLARFTIRLTWYYRICHLWLPICRRI